MPYVSLSSPDLAPNAFVITGESADAVRQAVRGWIKDGVVVEFPTRGVQERTFIVHFGRVASVDVSGLSIDTPEYATVAWHLESLDEVRVIK